MKILILTNKLPYPPKDGGSIATLNMMTGLRDAGNQITCLSLNTSKHPFPVEKIPVALRQTIRFMGLDCDTSLKPFRMLLNLLFSGKPYIAQRFNTPNYREELGELLRKESFDLVQLEGPYPGLYMDTIKKWSQSPVSLRAHNVEYLIWKRKADNEKSLLRRWYVGNMARRLERFELGVAREVDCLIPISPQDEEMFRKKGIEKPSLAIPAGLSLEAYPMDPMPEEQTIFFIGALDWLPNQEGITWFLKNVFGSLTEEMPQLRFHIAGRNPPAHFEKLLDYPQIIYHGEVDDAVAFMQSYRVMVVPILTGSGIRIKILEGMALGRPVVTTSIGIEGIPAETGREVLVADDPDHFKDQIVSSLTMDDMTRSMVASARQLITHNFDTFGLSTRLSQFFKTQV